MNSKGFYLDGFKPMDFGWMDFNLGDFVLIVWLYGSYSLPVIKGGGSSTNPPNVAEEDRQADYEKPELSSDTDKAYVTEEKKSRASPGGFCNGGFVFLPPVPDIILNSSSNTELSSANTELWPP